MVNPELAAAPPREHGEQTAENIDKEVDRIIQEGLSLATSVLEERRELIEKLALRLLEEQQIPGSEVRVALGLPPREETPPDEAKGQPEQGETGETEQQAAGEVEKPKG